MSLRLALHVSARADVVEAALWYERARAGWSREFEECLERTLVTVAERPKSFPAVRKDVRRALVAAVPLCGLLSRDRSAHPGFGGSPYIAIAEGVAKARDLAPNR